MERPCVDPLPEWGVTECLRKAEGHDEADEDAVRAATCGRWRPGRSRTADTRCSRPALRQCSWVASTRPAQETAPRPATLPGCHERAAPRAKLPPAAGRHPERSSLTPRMRKRANT